MKIVVAGGTGFIGGPLVSALESRGDQVVVLSREVRRPNQVVWDGKAVGAWAKELETADAVINLAGSPINQRWDAAGKVSILRSRVDSCRALGQAIQGAKNRPKVWVQGSAVGFYGDTGETLVDESSPAGSGFLGETCLAWEGAAQEYSDGLCQSFIRTGIVFGKGGGAMDPLIKLTRSFLGGAAGNGRQFMPWIHLQDIVGVMLWALDTRYVGPLNGVQPVPARNSKVMAALRKAMGRPWSPPAPTLGIKLVEAVAGIPSELILGSQRVTTKVLPGKYAFAVPELDAAVRSCI